jgi:hypothetical protein
MGASALFALLTACMMLPDQMIRRHSHRLHYNETVTHVPGSMGALEAAPVSFSCTQQCQSNYDK